MKRTTSPSRGENEVSPNRPISRASIDTTGHNAAQPSGRLSEMLVAQRRPTTTFALRGPNNGGIGNRNRTTSITQQTVSTLSSLTAKRFAQDAAATSTSPQRPSHLGSPIPLLHLTVVEKIRLRLMYDVAANSSSSSAQSEAVTVPSSRLATTAASGSEQSTSTYCPLLLQDYVVLSLLHRSGIRPVPPAADLKKIITRVAHANTVPVLAPPDEDGVIGTVWEVPSVITFDIFLQIVEVVKRWALREAELDEVGTAFQQLTQNQKRITNGNKLSVRSNSAAFDTSVALDAAPLLSVQDRSITPRLSIVDDALEPKRLSFLQSGTSANNLTTAGSSSSSNNKYLSIGTLKEIVSQGGADFDIETLLKSVDPNFEEHKGGKVDLKLFRWIAGEDDPDVVKAFVSLGGEVSLSGTIPVDQLVEKCEALQMTPQYIANFVSALDVNNDGLVDFNEFLSLVARSRRDMMQKTVPAPSAAAVNAAGGSTAASTLQRLSQSHVQLQKTVPTAANEPPPPVVTMRAKSLFNAENDGEAVAPDDAPTTIPNNVGLLKAEGVAGQDPIPRRQRFLRESNDPADNAKRPSLLPQQQHMQQPKGATGTMRELFDQSVTTALDGEMQQLLVVEDEDEETPSRQGETKSDGEDGSHSNESSEEGADDDGGALTALDRLATAADQDAESRRAARLMRKRQSVTATHLGIGLSGKLVEMSKDTSASHRQRTGAGQLRDRLEATSRQARSNILQVRERSHSAVQQLQQTKQRVLVKVQGGLVDAKVCQGPKGDERMLEERARVQTAVTPRLKAVEGLDNNPSEFPRKKTPKKVSKVSARLTALPKRRLEALEREVAYLAATEADQQMPQPKIAAGPALLVSAPPTQSTRNVPPADTVHHDTAPEHRHYRELKRGPPAGDANRIAAQQMDSNPLPTRTTVPQVRAAEPAEDEMPAMMAAAPRPQRPASAAVRRPQSRNSPQDPSQLGDPSSLWKLLEENRTRLERARTPSYQQPPPSSRHTTMTSMEDGNAARKAFARTIASHVAMRMPLDDPQWEQAPTPDNIYQAYILRAPQPQRPTSATTRPTSATHRHLQQRSATSAETRPLVPQHSTAAPQQQQQSPSTTMAKPHRPQTAPSVRTRPTSARPNRPVPTPPMNRQHNYYHMVNAHGEDDDPHIEPNAGDDVDVAYL